MILQGFDEDYMIEKQIGYGFEGSVYKVQSNEDFKFNAVKVIKKETL